MLWNANCKGTILSTSSTRIVKGINCASITGVTFFSFPSESEPGQSIDSNTTKLFEISNTTLQNARHCGRRGRATQTYHFPAKLQNGLHFNISKVVGDEGLFFSTTPDVVRHIHEHEVYGRWKCLIVVILLALDEHMGVNAGEVSDRILCFS